MAANWTNKSQPFGQNRQPALTGVSSVDGVTVIPIAVNPTTGGILTSTTGAGSSVEITDGTNTANVVAGDTGFNGLVTNAGTKTITFTTSATGAQILGPYNVEGYAYAIVNLTSAGVGLAWAAQWASSSGGAYSNSNTWFRSDQTSNITSTLSVTTNIFTTSRVLSNFFQLNISAMTSGTTTGTIILTNAPLTPHTFGVAAQQNGTWTVGSNSATGSAVPANAFYIGGNNGGNLVGTNISTSLADASSNTRNTLSVDARPSIYNGSTWDRVYSGGVTGMQGVSLQASPSGGYSYTNITSATTTLVKSGSGTLHAIIVNTPVVSGVIEFDDALTHTTPKIGTITYPATLVTDGPDSTIYDLAFATGLSITTTGTMDITVVWK